MSAVTAEPVVFHATDPAGPDETVILTGDGFGTAPKVAMSRPSGPAGDPAQPAPPLGMPFGNVPVLRGDDHSLAFVIPDMTAGVYLYTVGRSPIYVLNRPVVWWAQGDQGAGASPGGWLRLFGKCLGWPGKGPAATVALQGPKSLRLPVKGDPWSARVDLPRDLPPGTYRAWLHNGEGAWYGWSEPLTLTVDRPQPWPQTVYNVRDRGADGSGTRDDTAALQATLDAAGAAGGGIVLLPRGRYQVTAGLTVPPRVVLRGAGTQLAALFWPDMDTPPEALIRGTHQFAVEDLTVYASRHRHILVGDLGDQPDAGQVAFRRVRVRADAYRGHLTEAEVDQRLRETQRIVGGDTVRVGGDNVVIEDCDLYGSGRALYFSRMRHGRVSGNHLYNGRWGWYCISGSDGLIFEGNTITGADLMSTGGGLNCLDGSSYSQNVWYAHNTLERMHGWDREAMTSDAGGGLYYGPIVSADGVTLKLPEALKPGGKNWAGAGVFVFDGKGWTQVRRVAKVEGDKVTIDRPWDVPPDASSKIGITMLQQHYLLVDNDFSDAGIAIQFYGSSYEHVVAGNRCRRAGGYQAIGKPYGGYQLPPEQNPCHQPSWFCAFLDNVIEEGSIYRSGANNAILSGDSVIGVLGWPLKGDWPWPYNVGAVVRRNRLLNNAHIQVGDRVSPTIAVRDVVVEGNTLADGALGIVVDGVADDVVVRRNSFARVVDPLSGAGVPRVIAPDEQRSAAQVSALRAAAAAAGLPGDPAQDPAVAAAGSDPVALQSTALAYLARAGKPLPLGVVAPLLGLTVQGAPGFLLQNLPANGGHARFALNVAAPRVAAPWPASLRVEFPAGWSATPEPGSTWPGALKPAPAQTVAWSVTVPGEGQAWGRRELPVELVLNPDKAPLRLTAAITVGSSVIRDWMVAGPFANQTGQPLDLAIAPPEDGLDLKATYDGPAGKVAWKPTRLPGDALDSGTSGIKGPAVIFAVADIEAERETPAVLHLGTNGGYAVQLNGAYVTSANLARPLKADQDRVPLTLRAGDNVLLLKLSSNAAEPLRAIVELTPPAGGFTGKVYPVPADQFAGRGAFAPPPPRPAPATGEVRHAAGVAWQLAYADDFTTAGLSPRWRPAVGTWHAAGGVLTTGGDKAFLAYAEKLPAPVRIEYDTKLAGNTPTDLSAFWLADPAQYASGYLLGFGSNGNTLDKVLIGGSEVATATRPLVQPGKWHHVIAQILANGRVQLIIDDQLAIDHGGPAPGDAKHPGLWAWGGEAAFSKVRIYGGAR